MPPVDVLALAGTAIAHAQAAMAGQAGPHAPAPAPWALPQPQPQWPVPAPAPAWPSALLGALPAQWPAAAPAALPPMWGAAPAAPSAAVPTDLLSLLLRQAAAPAAAPQAAQPGPSLEQVEALVSAFRAAGEQHLRQHQGDCQVAALLARIAAQTPEQSAAQLQQLLSALVQPL